VVPGLAQNAHTDSSELADSPAAQYIKPLLELWSSGDAVQVVPNTLLSNLAETYSFQPFENFKTRFGCPNIINIPTVCRLLSC